MAGSWKPLAHQPTFAASTMFLLTDGRVMCQQAGGMQWWALTPDAHGDYAKGTWKALAPMANTRLYYSSAVLADGRVLVIGGEYSDAGSETNAAEIYDPVTDAWAKVSPPAGWTRVGDGACCLLPDGTFLLGNLDDTRTAIYDPVAGTWRAAAAKGDKSSEESWVLLADQTVLTVQCAAHPAGAEKYVIAADKWVPAGAPPDDLVENGSIEIGAGLLLPDGRALFIGATGKNALYAPPAVANQPGTWSRGPDFPKDANHVQLIAKDAPACLLPNGKVLCVAGPFDPDPNKYGKPTSFFEFDNGALVRVADPPNNANEPYQGRMMLLPTGQVLFAAGTSEVHVYTPDGAPDPTWRPTITSCPNQLRPLQTYQLQGRQFNGLSQAVGYGDDSSTATNYPLVRLTATGVAGGRVIYCRTFDHTGMGVATGTAVHSTTFAVPDTAPVGAYSLQVIANGIASDPVAVSVRPVGWWNGWNEALVNRLIGSLADGDLWVLGPNGPIPVDPWGPKVLAEAIHARKSIIAGVRELQRLGAHVNRERAVAAAAVAPAVDLDAQGGGDDDDEAGGDGTAAAKSAAAAKAAGSGANA